MEVPRRGSTGARLLVVDGASSRGASAFLGGKRGGRTKLPITDFLP